MPSTLTMMPGSEQTYEDERLEARLLRRKGQDIQALVYRHCADHEHDVLFALRTGPQTSMVRQFEDVTLARVPHEHGGSYAVLTRADGPSVVVPYDLEQSPRRILPGGSASELQEAADGRDLLRDMALWSEFNEMYRHDHDGRYPSVRPEHRAMTSLDSLMEEPQSPAEAGWRDVIMHDWYCGQQMNRFGPDDRAGICARNAGWHLLGMTAALALGFESTALCLGAYSVLHAVVADTRPDHVGLIGTVRDVYSVLRARGNPLL